MANKKYVVKLSGDERARLEALVSKGKAAAKAILKARLLLKADQSEAGAGLTDEKICEALDTNFRVDQVQGLPASRQRPASQRVCESGS